MGRLICRRCKKIREEEGSEGLKKRGFKDNINRIKTKRNFPFGKKSKPLIQKLYCKNCGGTNFEEKEKDYHMLKCKEFKE